MGRRPYYHAVAFDFDGTLVDTMGRYADIASEEMAAAFDTDPALARGLYLETSGLPFFQQLALIYGDDPRNAGCSDRFEARKASYLEGVVLSEEARAAVLALRQLGLSIAITSNNFQALLDRFVTREPGLFDLVLGFGDGISKGPAQFSRVRDRFGVDRRHLLFVGDSLTDRRKALAFGLDFVGVLGTMPAEAFQAVFPGTACVESLSELVQLVSAGSPVSSMAGRSP